MRYFFIVSIPLLLLLTACEKWDLNKKPDIETFPATGIGFTSVIVGGKVTTFYGDEIIQKGICYSTGHNPTINNQIKLVKPSSGSFLCEITGLQLNNEYFFRVYVRSSLGITYGNELSFRTLEGEGNPILITDTVTNIKNTSAKIECNILHQGDFPITDRGICWSKNTIPTISDHSILCGSGTGQFFGVISNLEMNTKYYVRCFAVNSSGSFYGNILNFTTLYDTLNFPIVNTLPVNSITQFTALSGGDIITDHGFSITKRGVCWSKLSLPTTDDSISDDGGGTGSFFSVLYGLEPNQSYFIRAYATNINGTAYGQQLSFTTQSFAGDLPVVFTEAASNITSNSSLCGGIVTGEGSFPVSNRGVCWSNSSMPTIMDNKTHDGAGPGTFTSQLAGLQANTFYYARAYATNSAGTSYGNEITFSTTGSTGLYLGQMYGGGVIFYLDFTGQHGYIVTMPDLQFGVTWGCYGNDLPGFNDTVIGCGQQNTTSIVNNCQEAGIAAKICDNLTLNGFSDWYLPSKSELNLLYQNRQYIQNLVMGYYWSSSEANAFEAWQINFSSGLSMKYGKYDPAIVRAIRSF
ncbi:MAG: DUF1566 domain-containing protein [Bacteroidales bacterium]